MGSEEVYLPELLKKLSPDLTFRPDDGSFRSKLVEAVIDNTDEESAEIFSDDTCDIKVSISIHTIEEGTIRFLVVSDLGVQTLEIAISALNKEEIKDLYKQLSRQVELHPPCSKQSSPKVIIRKNVNGMFCAHDASQILGCSQNFLKSRIPCSDYTYREVDGKKEIKEYYWSIILINRLRSIKLNGAKAEDVKFIADECCDGDCRWAEEIFVSLGFSMSSPKFDAELPNGMIK
jgi:hypothetical protein